MTILSMKKLALAALVAFGLSVSASANAGVLRTGDGVVVTTKEGVEVQTTEASDECPRAVSEAPMVSAHHDKAVFFAFNSSDLNRHEKRKLMHMARKINIKAKRGAEPVTVTVVGFADSMGNAAYNEKLALRRAKTVRDFLVKSGVKAKKVEVRSLGKSEASTNCPETMPRAKRIECSREDRRVEILVSR